MGWIVHLSIPVFAALIVVALGDSGFSSLLPTYGFLSAPYWLWFLFSEYLVRSRYGAFGGFLGIHFLMIALAILVYASESREASNGWLIYLLGAPIAASIGASVGERFGSRFNRTA